MRVQTLGPDGYGADMLQLGCVINAPKRSKDGLVPPLNRGPPAKKRAKLVPCWSDGRERSVVVESEMINPFCLQLL